MKISDDIREFLQLAAQAPSADNTQPWEVAVSDRNVSLYVVPERDTMLYDSKLMPSLISHGAFIENFILAASHGGYSVDVSFSKPDSSNHWLLAKLALIEKQDDNSSNLDLLFNQIPIRETNRKPYKTNTLPSDVKTSLTNSVNTLQKNCLKIVDYPQPALVNALAVAGRVMFQNSHVHSGLFEHIRWNEADVQESRDGFSIKTFELPPPAELIFRLARSKKRLAFLNKYLQLSKKIPSGMAQSFSKSGAYIAITSRGNTHEDYVMTGRIMQRVWLAGTSLGLSFHPIGALLFLQAALTNNKKDLVFSQDEVTMINQAYEVVRQAFSVDDEQVLFLFRVGYSTKATMRTLRYALDEIMR